jgi:hypothetical protein
VKIVVSIITGNAGECGSRHRYYNSVAWKYRDQSAHSAVRRRPLHPWTKQPHVRGACSASLLRQVCADYRAAGNTTRRRRWSCRIFSWPRRVLTFLGLVPWDDLVGEANAGHAAVGDLTTAADGADQPRVASLVLPFVAIALLALEGRRRAGANRLAAPADLGPQHRTQRRTLGVTSAITSKLRPHALRAGRLSHRQSRETSGPKPPNKLTESGSLREVPKVRIRLPPAESRTNSEARPTDCHHRGPRSRILKQGPAGQVKAKGAALRVFEIRR